MGTDERREDIRINTDLQAEYWAKGSSKQSGAASIKDFSKSGLRMLLKDPVEPGEQIDLSLTVPGDNIPIFATAEVAWAEGQDTETGAGLKLTSIRPLDLARLMDFVYAKWLGNSKKKVH